jgi:hypothetical protein
VSELVGELLPSIALDPVFGWIVRLGLALLFAAAVTHKLRDMPRFIATLQGYRLLPRALAAPAAIVLCAAEGATAATLAVPALDPLGAIAALGLLCTYGAAVGINLARGRRDIDCGCLGPANRQTLSPWLLVRNGVLALGTATLLAGVGGRELIWLDVFSIACGVAVLALLWHAFHQLGAHQLGALETPRQSRAAQEGLA